MLTKTDSKKKVNKIQFKVRVVAEDIDITPSLLRDLISDIASLASENEDYKFIHEVAVCLTKTEDNENCKDIDAMIMLTNKTKDYFGCINYNATYKKA